MIETATFVEYLLLKRHRRVIRYLPEGSVSALKLREDPVHLIIIWYNSTASAAVVSLKTPC